MALKIRLRRMGRKKAPHYRIVVAESSMPRDGRFVANLGHYNPRTQPATLKVDLERSREWIARGAAPTETVVSLFKKAGLYSGASSDADTSASRGGAVATVRSAAASAASAVASVVSGAAEQVRDAAETVVETVTGSADDETGERAAADQQNA